MIQYSFILHAETFTSPNGSPLFSGIDSFFFFLLEHRYKRRKLPMRVWWLNSSLGSVYS